MVANRPTARPASASPSAQRSQYALENPSNLKEPECEGIKKLRESTGVERPQQTRNC